VKNTPMALQSGRVVILLFSGMICLFGHAQENGSICISRQTTFGLSIGGGGCGPSVAVGVVKSLDVRVPPGQSFTFSENEEGLTFSVGPQSSLSEGLRELRPRNERPHSIPISVDQTRKTYSEFTEVEPGNGVFLGARHSLQDIQFGGLSLALAKDPKLAGSNFRIFGFRNETQDNNTVDLDALILVQNRETELADNIIAEIRTLLGSDKFTLNLQPRDLFYAYQMSRDNSAEERIVQDSLGPISSLTESGNVAFLPIGGENYTAPGSSGSIIFVRPSSNASQNQRQIPWMIGGLVSCGVVANNANPSEMRFSKIEVITVKALKNSQIYEVFETDLRTEKRSKNPRCVPLDGRGAGGL
jgi:hypothetical protein